MYSTKEICEELSWRKFGSNVLEKEEFKILWSKLVPPKVVVHVWRVMWERIPTSTKLLRRGCLPQGVQVTCKFCEVEDESVRHVLVECEYSYGVWSKVLNWLGVFTALPSKPAMSLLQFRGLFKCKERRSFGVCVWECVVWLLWKARNAKTFRNEVVSCDKLLAEVKVHVCSWVRSRSDVCISGSFKD